MHRWSRCYLRFVAKPIREISNRLGVDLRLVPFLQNSEIVNAFRPWLAARPSMTFQTVARMSFLSSEHARVPNTLPVFKQPAGAAYQQNFDFRARTGALEHWCGTKKAFPEIGIFFASFRRGIIATTKCSCSENQTLGAAMLVLACKGCGAELSAGSKRCRVCGISRPGSLLRASIIRPTALALLWLATATG